jgi:hypothetical protein
MVLAEIVRDAAAERAGMAGVVQQVVGEIPEDRAGEDRQRRGPDQEPQR